jgi:DNA-binding response OmpR family regulator
LSTLRKTVLIIEDNLDVRDALAVALTIEGYNVVAAENRDEALDALDEIQPALILMDHQMPGLSAADFMLLIRERHERVPVVLMTAGHSAPNKAMQLGLKHALQKPFDHRTLLRTVGQLTRRATQIIRANSQRELAVQ